MSEKSVDRKSKSDLTDLAAAGSLLVGATLGLARLATDIRKHFHYNYVEAYRERGSIFSDVREKFIGKDGVFDTHAKDHIAQRNALETLDGASIDVQKQKRALGTAHTTETRQSARQYRTAIDKLLYDYDGIHSPDPEGLKMNWASIKKNVQGWTVGTWQRFEKLGTTARIESTLGFAAIAATAIGAAIVLQHNAHRTDRVGSKVDDLREDFEKKEVGTSR